ncbi:hypothetical protein BKI52_26690 [marine bacterium AO1-C]|nr:hypothetical protein BKI52_26690 [marine bacterium AO1-C]
MPQTAQYFIEKLDLNAHPEGGYYKETYRADGTIPQVTLPGGYTGDRNYATSIYFLLDSDTFSAFHRIRSDELWHFHAGTALNLYIIDIQGKLTTIKVGSNLDNREQLQAIIPANSWFAAQVIEANSFTLVGCTVAPGFDFDDFELANRDELKTMFPQHNELITNLTRLQ